MIRYIMTSPSGFHVAGFGGWTSLIADAASWATREDAEACIARERAKCIPHDRIPTCRVDPVDADALRTWEGKGQPRRPSVAFVRDARGNYVRA